MLSDYLLTDRHIQVADEALARLLFGFEDAPNRMSASDGLLQEPICSVCRMAQTGQHGVESLTAAHPVTHVLSLTRHQAAILMADDSFEHATLRGASDEALSELMLLAVYSRLAYFQTVFVHGALVDVPGVGGLMFVGHSGVGKTTQAMLWEAYRGADIINGDKVFLAMRPDAPQTVLAYGSPWRGSSPYCINRRVPLRAIIVLRRRPEKYIRRLTELEALSAYVPHIFMPGWDPRLTACVMETLDTMIPLVPVYEMSCAPDVTAVDMADEAVFAFAGKGD